MSAFKMDVFVQTCRKNKGPLILTSFSIETKDLGSTYRLGKQAKVRMNICAVNAPPLQFRNRLDVAELRQQSATAASSRANLKY
jgi:hypothetical protein